MTTLALIADIHGNLPALDAVIESAGDQPDAWLCAGDIAGHLPMVDEVIARLQDLGAQCVLGDHDNAIVHNLTKVDSLAASWVLREQQELISKKGRNYLASLPDRLILEFDGFSILMLHGGPTDPLQQRVELVTPDLLGSFDQDILVVGHRHRPLVYVTPKKAVLNPGSVGLQVDGQKLARFMLVELPSLHVKLMEVPYNPNPLFRKMRTRGYDERYFNSLNEGRWVGFSNPYKRVPVIIVGAGIYGQIIAELISDTPDKFVVGFVDDTPDLQDQIVAGLPVLGKLSHLDNIAREAEVTEVAVAIGDNIAREKVGRLVKSLGLRLAILVHPRASVSISAKLSPGVVVDALAYIGPNCVLEEGVSVWPSVSVSHDTHIQKYVSLKPNVVVGGCSVIEEGLKVPLGTHWDSYCKLTSENIQTQK